MDCNAIVDDFISEEVTNLADCAANEVLPAKSKHRYFKVYSDFEKWKKMKKANTISEQVLLAYFYELSRSVAPTSLWATYSMLKATIKVKTNIDIAQYHQINAFLKAKSVGYKPVQAKVFTEREIQQFISEATDYDWLDVKVVCIFGVSGALRTDELTKVKVADIEQHANLLLVRMPETKTKVARSFTITGEFFGIVQKYAALRVPNMKDDRFFVHFRRGKCTAQVIGVNTFKKIPARIAKFLSLSDAERYTGHSFRRTSASILANTGASTERLQRHGAWRSPKVAEQYVEQSLHYKKQTGDIITSTITSAMSKTNASETESTLTMSQGYAQYVNYEEDVALDTILSDYTKENENRSSAITFAISKTNTNETKSTVTMSQGYAKCEKYEEDETIQCDDAKENENPSELNMLTSTSNRVSDQLAISDQSPISDQSVDNALKMFNFKTMKDCKITINFHK